ncbi:MAG: ferredoxin [Candidatus Gracilibacteria bacterium]|jgi:ferredoxin
MEKKNLKVDQKICIGCMLCNQIASANFSINDDGKAIIKSSKNLDEKKIKQLIDACPVSAIKEELCS